MLRTCCACAQASGPVPGALRERLRDVSSVLRLNNLLMMGIFIHRVKERDHAHGEKSQNKLKQTVIL